VLLASALLPGCSLATDLDELGAGGAASGGSATVSSSGAGASTATAGSSGGAGGSSGHGGASSSGGGSGGMGGELVARFGEHDLADYKGVTTDAFVTLAEPGANYGSDDFIQIDADPANVGLMRFEVSALGASVTVTGVELHLGTAGDDSAGEVNFFEVLEAWDQGQGSGDPGACNWTDRKPGVAWATAGVGPGSRGMFSLGALSPVNAYADYVVVLPPELVQGWLADPDANFGLALVTASPDSVDLRASSHAQSGHRPMLVVSYTE